MSIGASLARCCASVKCNARTLTVKGSSPSWCVMRKPFFFISSTCAGHMSMKVTSSPARTIYAPRYNRRPLRLRRLRFSYPSLLSCHTLRRKMKSGHHNPLLSAPRRRGLLASILATACFPQGIAAQSSAKFYRIGWITAQRAPSLAPYLDAFRIGLTDLGYVEGRDLVIEYRYADDAIERVPELATELVRVPVDVLVAQGAAAFEIH